MCCRSWKRPFSWGHPPLLALTIFLPSLSVWSFAFVCVIWFWGGEEREGWEREKEEGREQENEVWRLDGRADLDRAGGWRKTWPEHTVRIKLNTKWKKNTSTLIPITSHSTAPWLRRWSSTVKSFEQHVGPFHNSSYNSYQRNDFPSYGRCWSPPGELQGILLFLLEIRSVCLVRVMTPPFSTAASFSLSSHTLPQFSRFYQPHPIALPGFSPEDVFPGCKWFVPSLCEDFHVDAASQKDDEIWWITWLTLNTPVAASHFFTAVYIFIGCVIHAACALVEGKF